jgi:hypothetical protein
MAIGTQHLTRLSPDQVRSIKTAMARLDDAKLALETAAAALPAAGFATERAKLIRSAEGIKWERQTVDERLNELLDKGKKIDDCCRACGCALPVNAEGKTAGATCDVCGWTKPGTLKVPMPVMDEEPRL